MTSAVERQQLLTMIHEACQSGCRLTKACDEVKISLRTYRRWWHDGQVQEDKRPEANSLPPANKLSEGEVQIILDIANRDDYASLPPSQIVPSLLDEGRYIASESSFYRVLKRHGQLHKRGRQREHNLVAKPEAQTATGPNQVYTWDITYLASAVKGQFYYLYLIEDIYSRKIVGYEVWDKECGELASALLQRTLLREQCFGSLKVLHSDNGAPMKSQTLRAKMEELNISGSRSRPGVSNDNPYVESLFRTLKYRPQWPEKGFANIELARKWVEEFACWYNDVHRHSKLKYVTPSQRHNGEDREILAKRKSILEQAKALNPKRWSGNTRNCVPVGSVTLNPDKKDANCEADNVA